MLFFKECCVRQIFIEAPVKFSSFDIQLKNRPSTRGYAERLYAVTYVALLRNVEMKIAGSVSFYVICKGNWPVVIYRLV